MQDTEHDTSSEEATAAEAAAATAAVHAALTGGRPADARARATAAHTQRHDVRAALAAAPNLAEAARLAEEQALEYPYDQRLAIRAETLTDLDRPGRHLLLAHVRAPLATLLTVTAIASALTITRAALHLPDWVSAIAVLLFVPGLALVSLERHAQARGLARLQSPPDETDLPKSPLPPPPALTSRQVAVNLAVLCVLLCSAASPLLWPSPENSDYPRYTPTAPATLLGAPLLSATDGTGQGTPAMWTETFDNSFLYLYGTPDRMTDDGAEPSAYVFGGIGDLHDAPADLIEGYEGGLAGTESTIDATWDAPPGARGGRLHCVSYATESEDAGAHSACTWLDRVSLGVVVMNEPGLDHDTAAETARSTRDAILREDGSGGTEASAPGSLRVL